MYPVSAKFLKALRKNHTVTNRVEFLRGGEVVAETSVLGGTVSEDRTAQVRRRCSLSLSGADGAVPLPGVADYLASPLWPIGNEVKVYSGIRFNDGTTEEVPMGVFRIARPRLSHADGELIVGVDGYDRSRAVSRNRFTSAYWIAGGTDYGAAIEALIRNRMPSLVDSDFLFMPTDGSDGGTPFTTPWIVFLPQDDPWEKALEMAKACGAELFFDGNGRCVMQPEPDPLFTPSVFDYVAGQTATFATLDRDLDDEEAYNGVIVTGANNDNASLIPRGAAWDTAPTSPTYYDPDYPSQSFYGAVPYFYTSEYITTNAQAVATAKAMLLSVIGIVETVDLGAVSNPAHVGGDVVKITDPRTGIDGNYLLDSLNITLGDAGGMSATTRKRRVS